MLTFVERCKRWYRNQSHTAKAFVWIVLILVIALVVRWHYIVSEASRGFQYLKK
jgi:hypothetical protein